MNNNADYGKNEKGNLVMPQEFLPNGNLNPGIHNYNIEEFENQFIVDFPGSESRAAIYENFKRWLQILVKVLPPAYIWLDGSYLTKKLNPNDIDLIVFYDPDNISEDQSLLLQQLINKTSRDYNCDAYLCYTFDNWDPQRVALIPNMHTIMRTYWMGQFGFDRQQQAKGIIQLNQQELISYSIGGVTA